MMKKIFLLTLFGGMMACVNAQRATDNLDRGLVALQAYTWSNKVTLTWRVLASEYHDVTYNVYRDGVKLNASPLYVSFYEDAQGSSTASYTIRPVVNGVEGTDSKAVTAWTKGTNYKELTMDHGTLTSTYIPNDVCCADVDGDGELEIILKFDNRTDIEAGYPDWGVGGTSGNPGETAIAEVYKLDGTKLWWLSAGPSVTDFQNNEFNIVAYDWDGDGKAEVVLRGADGTCIHTKDGQTIMVGDPTFSARTFGFTRNSSFTFTNTGREYLLYLNGETGQPYAIGDNGELWIDYPLPRIEESEWKTLSVNVPYNDYKALQAKGGGNYHTKSTGVLWKAWGDNYGHRSSKHFFGAPYLDGRKPSIFLGRGIYTRHKFIALDVDPATHKLTVRWRWNCNNSSSPWYGNGNHNYTIADVDWDGRDEIVYGSMTIDDNGCGLSTSGYGHGDAIHVSDLDPYRHGQEVFACLEEEYAPYGNNFRDATTSEVLYKFDASKDDGRCIMGNFSNTYPGCIGASAYSEVISSVTHGVISGASKENMAQNFRIYWDGDLLEETFNYSNGKNTEGAIIKYGGGSIATLKGSLTNNDTKGTPCYQGDILGDWREEVIMRTEDNNIRIYTTSTKTTYRMPSLWEDHQYRNAMVWQMCGYNQPPHVSYFVGDLEGFTVAPPPLTMNGRQELTNGQTISGTSQNHLVMCDYRDMTVTVSAGAAPAGLTVNAPSWVQGTDVDGTSGKYPTINRQYYTHTLTGGALSGSMYLVKQGDGVLNMASVEHTYTGNTDIWAGTVNFDGQFTNSRVWLHRFSTFSGSATFGKTLQMEYASALYPGGASNRGTVVVGDTLLLNYGSRIVVDLYGEDMTADLIKTKVLKIEKKTFRNGPKYLAPVIELNCHYATGEEKLPAGRYLLFEAQSVDGELSNLIVEGLTSQKFSFVEEDGKVYLNISDMRQPMMATWTGGSSDVWNTAEALNFKTADSNSDVFVTGDDVVFDDNAANTNSKVNVMISGQVKPATITFNNTKLAYTIGGEDGDIAGNVVINKSGTGTVSIENVNSFSGTININGGSILAAQLANRNNGQTTGSLGQISNVISLSNGGAIGVNKTSANGHPLALGEGGGSIEVASGATLTMENVITSASGASVHKIGSGALVLQGGNRLGRFCLDAGELMIPSDAGEVFTDVLELGSNVKLTQKHYQEATVSQEEQEQGIEPVVPQTTDRTQLYIGKDKSASFYLDGNCTYEGTLAGEGRLTLYPQDSANILKTDWSSFTGIVSVAASGSKWLGLSDGFRLDGGTLDVASGSEVIVDANVSIGTLLGNGTLAGTGTVSLGAAETSFTFSGAIETPVEKVGAGRWTITSSKPLPDIKSVVVREGELYLSSSWQLNSVFMGEAPVTVTNGGVLSGNGTIHTLLLQSGGVVTPGMTTQVGPIGTAGDLTAETGSVVNLNLVNGKDELRSRSYLTAGGKLTLNATVNVTLSDAYTPTIGDVFTLWEAATFEGTPSVQLPQLPAGFAWDTTDMLKAKGQLKVVAGNTDDIQTVQSAGLMRYQVYSMAGALVDEFTSSPQNMRAVVASMPLLPGIYMVRPQGSNHTVKVLIK